LVSDSVAPIERIRRGSFSYLEEFAIEKRSKMAPRWDAKARSYFLASPQVVHGIRIG